MSEHHPKTKQTVQNIVNQIAEKYVNNNIVKEVIGTPLKSGTHKLKIFAAGKPGGCVSDGRILC